MCTTQTPGPSLFRDFPSPEEIDRHLRNGRTLRAEATGAAARGLWRWLHGGRAAGRSLPAQGAEVGEFPEQATPLRSPLMAIRSSAEILRDNPDLTPAQRARFVAILIAEEQRLERLIARAFGAAELRGG